MTTAMSPANRIGDARDWIHPTNRPVWLWARQDARQATLSSLRGLSARLKTRPAALRGLGLGPSLDLVLGQTAIPGWLLSHPAAHAWLLFAREAISTPAAAATPADAMILSQFHGMAAALAAHRGMPFEAGTTLDQRGHLHFYGLRAYLDFGREQALRPATVSLDRETLRVWAGGLRAEIPREMLIEGLRSPTPGRDEPRLARFRGTLLRWQPAVTMSMEVTDCDPLVVLATRAPKGPKEHAVASLPPAEMERYVSVLRATVGEISAIDPSLAAEIADSIPVVVPLRRPDPKVHVSSTYDHLPGAVFLCHDEDPILQGETLVHEAAHNKLNALLALEPVFESAGADALYFSPWRPDPRPLRGLLLGAHAFLNVARFLALASKTRGGRQRRAHLQTEAAMRCLQVEISLDVLEAHGEMKALGRELLAGMRRSVRRIIDENLPAGPGGIWGAAKEPVEKHKRLYLDPASLRHRQAG